MTIDLSKFKIVLDVWDGTGEIDEATLKANGVEGLIVRMNTSWGGLQYDVNFLNQWKQAEGFKRAAYVVVSPLNVGHDFTPKEVVDWVLAWLPADCKVVGFDVEINAAALYNRPDITPRFYHDWLNGVIGGVQAKGYKVLQYSGGWFWNLVQPWITDVPQWWARYLNSIQGVVTKDAAGNPVYPLITWEALKARISAASWTPVVSPLTEAQVAGSDPGDHIVMWQVCSSWVLPGCQPNKPMDVNLISITDFEAIWGKPEVVVPPAVTIEDVKALLKPIDEKLASLAAGQSMQAGDMVQLKNDVAAIKTALGKPILAG